MLQYYLFHRDIHTKVKLNSWVFYCTIKALKNKSEILFLTTSYWTLVCYLQEVIAMEWAERVATLPLSHQAAMA